MSRNFYDPTPEE
jgi:hypothetical protein